MPMDELTTEPGAYLLIIEIDALGQEIVQSIAADSVPRRRRAA